MRRTVFSIIVTLSLLACAAFLAGWVRSYYVADQWRDYQSPFVLVIRKDVNYAYGTAKEFMRQSVIKREFFIQPQMDVLRLLVTLQVEVVESRTFTVGLCVEIIYR